MVPMLALLTFVAFIVVTWFLSHGRQTAAADASSPEALRAPPVAALAAASPSHSYFHPGHAWVRLAPDGFATVGATDFAANFVGTLSRVEAPEPGRWLRQGEPAWTLVSTRNRRLTQPMPLDGEIVAVNRRVQEAPDRDGSAAEGRAEAWILRVRPTLLGENLRNLLQGPLADGWREAAGMRLNAVLTPALGRLAHDGGVWMENFGDQLSDSDWLALRRELFPRPEGDADR